MKKDKVKKTKEDKKKNKEYANTLLEVSNSIVVYDLEAEVKNEE